MPKPKLLLPSEKEVETLEYLGSMADWMENYARGRTVPKPQHGLCVMVPVSALEAAAAYLRRLGLYGEREKQLKELVDGK